MKQSNNTRRPYVRPDVTIVCFECESEAMLAASPGPSVDPSHPVVDPSLGNKPRSRSEAWDDYDAW